MLDRSARIAVIIASKGRSDCLRAMVTHLARQTLTPSTVILSLTEPADAAFAVAPLLPAATKTQVIYSKAGTCRQRNAGIDQIPTGTDYVVFFDDDFFPSRFALEGIARGFAAHPSVDGMTGALICDGINTPGIPVKQAIALLRAYDDRALDSGCLNNTPNILRDTDGLYGCNMAMRVSAIKGLRFDERLPVYGWQEDVDFAAQLAGRRVETDAFTGIHLGTKAARPSNGERLGYSQVVNPFYLWRKGTMRAQFALRLASRNIAANHLKSLRPEPWVDRASRVRGNWIGLFDILLGRADPERIIDWRSPRPNARRTAQG